MKLHRFLLGLLLALSVSVEAAPPAPTVQLLSAAAVSSAQLLWPGGGGVLTVNGTWNGATVTLQYVGADGTTLVTAGTACVLTANGNCVFYLPRSTIQATITSAGGSTSLYAAASILPSQIQ